MKKETGLTMTNTTSNVSCLYYTGITEDDKNMTVNNTTHNL